MRDSNRSSARWIHVAAMLCCLLGWTALSPAEALFATAWQETEPVPAPAPDQEPPAAEPVAPVPPAPESPSEETPETDAETAVEPSPEGDDEESRETERSRRSLRDRQRVDKDTQVHVMSDLWIDEGEVARDAIVVMGELHVNGKVLGDAVSIMGAVYVDGEVTGAVTSVGDDVHLGPESEVLGDVISVGGRVERAPGAKVLGEVSEIDIGPALNVSHLPWVWDDDGPRFWDGAPLGLAWSVFWTIFRWVLLVLLTSFVFLVARDAVEQTARTVSHEPWKAGLLGLATWLLFFPLMVVATIVLAISIIGIPLLIIVWPLGLFALLIACLVGYTATAYAIGGWLGRRFGWSSSNAYAALLLGVIAIQLFSLIGELFGRMGGFLWFFAFMFGLTGWLIRFSVWTAGLGATIMAFAERRRIGQPTPTTPSAPPSSGQPAERSSALPTVPEASSPEPAGDAGEGPAREAPPASDG